MNKSGYLGNMLTKQVVISAAGTKTPAFDLGGLTLVGIILPVMTGTALTFEISDALAGTYVPVKSTTSGSALSYTIASSTYAAIDPNAVMGLNFGKLVSGTTEVADRTITLILKGL